MQKLKSALPDDNEDDGPKKKRKGRGPKPPGSNRTHKGEVRSPVAGAPPDPERLAAVLELMEQWMPSSRIVALISRPADDHPEIEPRGFGVHPDTVWKDIRRIRADLKSDDEDERKHRRNAMHASLVATLRRSIRAKNLKMQLDTQVQIAKLHGLYEPEKVELSGSVENDISVGLEGLTRAERDQLRKLVTGRRKKADDDD